MALNIYEVVHVTCDQVSFFPFCLGDEGKKTPDRSRGLPDVPSVCLRPERRKSHANDFVSD